VRGHALLVRAIGFLPGGNAILTAGMDGTARVWDTDTGAELRVFDWGIGKIRVAAVAPDGLTCAAGGDSGQIVVWDVDA
jgi:WD40 repeat protein